MFSCFHVTSHYNCEFVLQELNILAIFLLHIHVCIGMKALKQTETFT